MEALLFALAAIVTAALALAFRWHAGTRRALQAEREEQEYREALERLARVDHPVPMRWRAWQAELEALSPFAEEWSGSLAEAFSREVGRIAASKRAERVAAEAKCFPPVAGRPRRRSRWIRTIATRLGSRR